MSKFIKKVFLFTDIIGEQFWQLCFACIFIYSTIALIPGLSKFFYLQNNLVINICTWFGYLLIYRIFLEIILIDYKQFNKLKKIVTTLSDSANLTNKLLQYNTISISSAIKNFFNFNQTYLVRTIIALGFTLYIIIILLNNISHNLFLTTYFTKLSAITNLNVNIKYVHLGNIQKFDIWSFLSKILAPSNLALNVVHVIYIRMMLEIILIKFNKYYLYNIIKEELEKKRR